MILFLHGNHATCGRIDRALGIRIDERIDYTLTGRCPSGYVVAPSHRGYAYLAERLAAAGYIVVSINANRGINAADGVDGDEGLNLRRGRLVLKHLQLLAEWNRNGGAPTSLGFNLKGKLDLSEIGLMGHSRGGEGMRAALAQYADAGSPWPQRIGTLGFKALFEIGPVDGQTSRTLDARGVAWNVLLPYCDGDVSDLEGVRPFDRMLRTRTEQPPMPKSTFAVYGANHNFYNTEWQQSDSAGCTGADNVRLFGNTGGSGRIRHTARLSLVPFMLAHVGKAAQPALAAMFDPAVPLPATLASVTKVDRGYSDTSDPTVVTTIERFDRSPEPAAPANRPTSGASSSKTCSPRTTTPSSERPRSTGPPVALTCIRPTGPPWVQGARWPASRHWNFGSRGNATARAGRTSRPRGSHQPIFRCSWCARTAVCRARSRCPSMSPCAGRSGAATPAASVCCIRS